LAIKLDENDILVWDPNALDLIVLPIFAPTGNDVGPLIEQVQHFRDIGRIILTVAVERNNDFAAGIIESRHHRGRLAEVLPEMDHSDARIVKKLIIAGVV